MSASGFRLSPQQRRLCLLQQSGEQPYRARCLALLQGDLDRQRLRATVAGVVDRFEILRTVYPCPAGLSLPVQRILPGAPFWGEETDLSGLSPAAREAALDRLFSAAGEAPLDLERGPVLRAELARLGPVEHTLLLALPALAADPATLVNLLREIGRSYADPSAPAEADGPLQYADLAEWQNDLLESEDSQAGRERWARWDPAALKALQIPFERRTAGSVFEPQSMPVPLDSVLGRRAARWAEDAAISGQVPFLAAWQVLLWRLTGQTEPTIGLWTEGRSYEGLGEALGLFAKTVPLTCRLSADLSFSQLASRIQEALEAAVDWQEFFHWEQIAEQTALDLDETVFPASFQAEDRPGSIPAGPLTLSPLRWHAPSDRFRLKLAVHGSAAGYTARIDYDASRFDRGDVETLARAFGHLFAGALSDPKKPVGTLHLAFAAETPWTTETGGRGADRLVHELFEDQARRAPQRCAVMCEERSLTYAQLDRRAGLLASWLQRQGIGPDTLVALCLERSVEMVLALLGTLKAGGAYLPLDPALPAERKALLLRDSGARIVLTQGRWRDQLPAGKLPVLTLDKDGWEIEADESPESAGSGAAPANLAYVLYTSGSTGAPKGVAVEHRQLVNYIRGIEGRLGLPGGATYAMVSTFAADLGNTVLFASLCGGGCLHLISPERVSDPQALADYFRRHPVDCLKIVPTHLEALTSGSAAAGILPRKRLVLGGEASRWEWIERLQSLAPDCAILNHYGPTETTVGVLTWPVGDSTQVPRRTATVPLGKPLPGVAVHLLDPNLDPLPDWFPGEICIGGASVSRGYLGHPALTAERFVPNPFPGLPGTRLYRTGDLARRLPDGTYEFLGRIDDQVKIRGFRVEPGEIETVLESHPAVRRAAVAAREDGYGTKRLVAYLVGDGRDIPVAELQDLLRVRLPEVMIPAALLVLPALPLTANGKIDRRALPEPDWRRIHQGGGERFEPPTTPVEQLIAEVWREVLGIERIGIHDDFFHLGGDSIRGIVVRSLAAERGVSFTVQQLFENPTIRELARQALPSGGTAAPAALEPFALLAPADRARIPAGVEDAYPLASLQAGMLFHSELAAGTAIFHDIHSFHVRAPFDETLLRKTVENAARRHPVLRTSFELTAYTEPLQLVHAGVVPPLAVYDLCALAEDDRGRTVREWLRQERQLPFDWSRPPLISFHVHRRSEESFQFTMSFHHSILDGWSSASLLTELFGRYAAWLRGEAGPVEPPPSVAFRDLVALEREVLTSAAAREHWQRELAGAPRTRIARVPVTDATRLQAPEVRTVFRDLPPGLSDRLKEAARSAGVPLKSALLAVHLRVLSFLGGEDDVMTGLVSHGRPEQTGAELALGLFLNTLPFRMRVGGGSWSDLARQALVRERDLFPFRRFPLAELQRMGGGEPLFEIAFNFLHFHVYQELAGIEGMDVLENNDYEESDFLVVAIFSLNPNSGDLRLVLEHRFPEIGGEQAEAICGYYLRALEAFAGTPEASCTAPLLSETECRQILEGWNDTAFPGPFARPVPEEVAVQARRRPEALAVASGNRRLTYGELAARSRRLALHLRALGVGPESRVGVCLERSVETVPVLLGVLAAGAAYVPFDPAYPAERLAFMASDAGISALLTQRRLRDRLPSVPVPVIDADLEAPVWESSPAPRELPRITAESLAYVIYTSGSTGWPKGVQVPHSSLLNLVSWHSRAHAVTADDRATQLAAPGFDAAAWEIWPYLTAGASLHVAPEEARLSPRQLLEWLAAEGITRSFLPTPLAEELLETCEREGVPEGLRLAAVLTGGDRLRRSPGPAVPFELINHYGPTECTVVATWARVPAGPAGAPPVIGRPVDNCRAYVLDSGLHPVPAGVAGELFLAGASLARGYLGRPDLTAERFLPDPFGEAGGRLYRTGDLVRWLPGGALDFLGRADDQIKVRGFRIEPGEIEAMLAAQPGIRQAAVVLREDSPGERRLVAYVVPETGHEPSLGDLRRALAERLPDYMIPAAFVLLEAFPVSLHGKLDRSRLPRPDASSQPHGTAYVAPRGSVEETLAAIWARVLRVERVGAEDDFFELGGDSILSLQISMQARQAGLEVSPRLLFQHPTLAGLAAVVATAAYPAQRTEPEAEPGPVPLTPIQRWFFAARPADPHWFNQAVLLATERLSPALLATALERIEARHDALRLRFANGPEGWSQTVTAATGRAPLTVVDLSALPEERHAAAVTGACAGAQRSFDLARGPLHRALLLDLGAERPGRLFWAAHHLTVDGVSWRILLDELAAAYAGADLPPRTASFSRWARRMAEHAGSRVLQEELAWWRDQPWGEAAPLPVDFPAGPAGASAPELAVTLRLSPGETAVLLREVPRAFGARIQEAFLTALARVWAEWTGTPVLHLDLEGHGREELFPDHDLSRTVGWLTALYPVLLDLRGARDATTALRAASDQLRRVPRGGAGFGLLRWLVGNEELAAVPSAQVVFNYLGQLDQALPGSSPFSATGEAMGSPRSPRTPRRHLLEWNGGVVNGSLTFTLTGSAVFRRETLERLAEAVTRELRELVARVTRAEETYPLTPLQEGMVFLSLYANQAETYAWQLSCRLAGPLDTMAFRRAWERVIERHGILRTRFVWEGLSRPLQVVARKAGLPLHEADWSALPAAGQRAALEDLLAGDLRRPFALGRAPLMRLILAREAPESHRLVWTTQPMLMDGWSMHRIIREAFLFYESLALGRPEPELETPRPFRDHVEWLAARKDTTDAELFWRRELAGFTAATPLPGDRGEAGRIGEPGKAQHRRPPLSAPATEALQELARSRRFTLNTLVQGAWALLLARTGGSRTVFGATVSGRPAELAGAESMIGLFINTLPVHVRVDPEAPLSIWLRALQDHHSEARQFEHLALPEIQGWSDVPRGQPLFESLIVFENYPVDRSVQEMGGSLQVEDVRLLDFINYPLTLVAAPGERLSLHVDYDRSRLPASEAALLMGRLEALLDAMVKNPEAPLAALLGPNEAERHQILHEWNDSAAGVPDLLPHEIIARWAQLHPEDIAVSLGGQRLTYGDLDRQAANLARWLVAAGAFPDSVVPIVSERDPGFLISMLAVFKVGAAYLPLDRSQPRLRLLQLIKASGAALVIAARSLAADLPQHLAEQAPGRAPRVLTIEDLQAKEAPAVALPARSLHQGLAYVIFTSGSTGLPKGAMVEQRGMLNHLWAKVTALGLNQEDVVAQTASQGFDISVWQFLAALLVGGRVEIFPDEVAHDPLRLARETERCGVTVLESVPSLLRLMLDELESRPAERPGLARLRWMIPTGEALPPDLCGRWLALYPEVPLLNAYGPTECSDDVTHHPIRHAPDALEAIVPIGRPVTRLRLYVLDGALRPVAPGVAGELFVGGAGLGRGYLNDGRRTAEVWVPDPVAADGPGSRLYRTGDLARHRVDGTLEFLGRIDHQVKIRGHRIELGEIEAVLASHPSVRHAVVLAREDMPGERRLVAYVVPRTGDGTGALDASKVDQWESIFDEVYSQEEAASARDAGVNLRVWVSSYSGDPLPEDEILECVDDSVGRILALRPRHLLEIGCGTGLLLFRIAPSCSSYSGTDVSAEVLANLERRLAAQPGLPPVELRHRAADDFEGIPQGAFDTVVLNEVAQYFPSVDYLVQVIEGAVASTAPGGAVFVGGLRSLPLLDAFHASVALWRAPDALSTDEIREEAQRRRAQEKELVVDPELLTVLAGCLPRVRGVSLQIKGGRARNELTRFRYDAVLWIEGPEEGATTAPSPARLDWRDLGTLEALRARLAQCGPETPVLEVHGLPNARLREELAALRLLRESGPATAGELRAALRANTPEVGIDPADLWDLGRELGWEVQVQWAEGTGPDVIDTSFARPGARPRPLAEPRPRPVSWSRFANDPLRSVVAENLVPELRSLAATRLPDPMLPAAYVLLEALPLTPNGKLDRKALPPPDQTRPELEASYTAPLTAAEKELTRIWEQVLRIDPIGVHDNFFELGGDSILSLQVVSRASRAGLRVTPRQMFQHPTIAELAAVAGTAVTEIAEQGPVTGPVPLTPIQHWFFEQGFREPQRWNLPVLLEVREPVAPAVLAAAWAAMLEHHDALRLRFEPGTGGWRQTGDAPGGRLPLVHLDLAALPADRRRQALTEAAEQVQGSLDLGRGPLARAALFELGTGLPARLLLAVHHLVIDGVSWRILLEDLETACRELAQGKPLELPLKTLSFRAWAERLVEHARSPQVAGEATYWGAEPRARAAFLPADFPAGANTVASARTLSVSLGETETQALLQEVPQAYQTRIEDALLTALAQALTGWTGRPSVLIELEGHGREELPGKDEVDVSRTVGWFTAEYPILLEVGASDPGQDLKAVKEQLRAVPGRGIGYGLLRYLGESESAARLAALPHAGLLFNYLGQLDQTFEPKGFFALAGEPPGNSQSPQERRGRAIEVNAWIVGGRLRADWTYSASLHRPATISSVAQSFLSALRALIDHCRSPEAGGYTPSDFAAARLDQGDLDDFLARLGGES